MKPRPKPAPALRHITPEQDRHMRRRTRFFCLAMAVVCFGVLLARLFVLQVLDPEGYADRAADQQLRDTVIPAARGEIYLKIAVFAVYGTDILDPHLRVIEKITLLRMQINDRSFHLFPPVSASWVSSG